MGVSWQNGPIVARRQMRTNRSTQQLLRKHEAWYYARCNKCRLGRLVWWTQAVFAVGEHKRNTQTDSYTIQQSLNTYWCVPPQITNKFSGKGWKYLECPSVEVSKGEFGDIRKAPTLDNVTWLPHCPHGKNSTAHLPSLTPCRVVSSSRLVVLISCLSSPAQYINVTSVISV